MNSEKQKQVGAAAGAPVSTPGDRCPVLGSAFSFQSNPGTSAPALRKRDNGITHLLTGGMIPF